MKKDRGVLLEKSPKKWSAMLASVAEEKQGCQGKKKKNRPLGGG